MSSCVLRMGTCQNILSVIKDTIDFLSDHHCPWVNNCVGHFNYGHFIRFLFYVDLACTYHFAMLTRRVLSYARGNFWVCNAITLLRNALTPIVLQDEPETVELIFIILNYATCVPVLLAVGGFRCDIIKLFSLNSN